MTMKKVFGYIRCLQLLAAVWLFLLVEVLLEYRFFSTKAVFSKNYSYENKPKMKNANRISNLALLLSALNSFLQCQYCNVDNSTECFEDSTNRAGFAAKLVLVCMMCDAQYTFCTSEVTKIVHENNIQLVTC
jgi:transcription elongation factor Elf1